MADAIGNSNLTQESFSSHVYTLDLPRVEEAIAGLQTEFGLPDADLSLLNKALSTLPARWQRKEDLYATTLKSVLEAARAPTTHVSCNCSVLF
jgi:proteasome activator subunit 4